MARIRTLKPEYWPDEKVGKLSMPARLLFIGLLNFSDDTGIVRGHPIYLRSMIFPYDDITCKDVLNWLKEIVDQGMIIPFQANDETFYEIKNFLKHQIINRPSKNINPRPCETNHGMITDQSLNDHGMITERSLTEREEEREEERDKEGKKEREREGIKDTPNPHGGDQPDEPQKPKPEKQNGGIPYGSIIDHLNQQTGKTFRSDSKNTKRRIKALWNRGFHMEDFIAVIDKKAAKWRGDPKMVDYLRPETLFGEKFESYLNETSSGKPVVQRYSETTAQNIVTLTAWAEGKDREEQAAISGKYDLDGRII